MYVINMEKRNGNDKRVFAQAYGTVALGTHLGNFSKEDSLKYVEAIKYAVRNGIYSIDGAINYRGMCSERDEGVALAELMNYDIITREEVFISSKAGLLYGDISAKPPRIIRYGLPENVIPNADNTPIPLKITYFLYFQFGKYPTTLAPSAAPSPMTKRAGPSSASFNPASGSFACRKNRTSVDTAPINAFTIITLLAFRLFFMKCQLSVTTF
jgi:hypothetical protein